MAIGPSGPPPGRGPVLPPMGGGRGPDLPPMNPAMGVGPGPDLPPMPRPGGDIMAAKQRLMQIAAEADAILTQHPELAQELMGDGGGVGGMPQMPVAGNTVPSGGGLLGGVV